MIAGLLNEPGTVTIYGVSVTVDASNNFRGTVPTTSGTNTFTIVAKDASGNTTTKQYEIDVSGSGKTFTYDANGNLISDGTRGLEWTARNQVAAISSGSHRSEFAYDGQQRRVRVLVEENSVTQSNLAILWCHREECEERSVEDGTATRRAFGQAEQASGLGRYLAADHLGSVTEVTNTTATVLTRYAFDPWGRRMLTGGSGEAAIGFAGYRAQTSLLMTKYRAYDPEIGRWLSEDPLGSTDGPNRFVYVQNEPISSIDPTGLIKVGIRKKCAERVRDVLVPSLQRAGAAGNDKYVHCVLSCYIAGTCGRDTAAAAGIYKEFEDWWFNSGTPDWYDWIADVRGIECAVESKRRRRSCEELCRRDYP